MVTIGVEHEGQELRATPADTVVLKLPENPTTGVRWEIDRVDGPLQLVGDTYELRQGGGIGAAATRVLTFQPSGRGRAELKLKKWQQWEGPSSVEASFSCSIVIDGAGH